MANAGIYHLFVYGSLRSGFQSPAYDYISRFFELVGPATACGRLYDLGSYPAGIPSEGEDRIVGELYQIKAESEFSWAIGQLDDYEGVDPEEGETALYRRAITRIRYAGGDMAAWIYWYNGDVTGTPRIDSGDLLSYLNSKK
ncbi:MAG: hypothetical protein RJA57_1878 [Bacteroidota bacterium]|jgi:gamma-glutamylcyclotransferase (GGCT)/AIG2-like uncharacterized protein YtfP